MLLIAQSRITAATDWAQARFTMIDFIALKRETFASDREVANNIRFSGP
jgi:hypothetical protein